MIYHKHNYVIFYAKKKYMGIKNTHRNCGCQVLFVTNKNFFLNKSS